MILEIIGVMLAIVVIAFITNSIEDYHRNKRVDMSFKEAMDLVELPIVTFYNNNIKLNFLLDTGSNICHINSSILPYIEYKELDNTMNIMGMEGNIVNNKFCSMNVTYKNQQFVSDFCITDLTQAFDNVKKESGVQIHGILGSLFFQKYKYILDFGSLIAYSKK